MPVYKVQDTITYERTWFVEAKDEDAALTLVHAGLIGADEEEQISNTPYEAEELRP